MYYQDVQKLKNLATSLKEMGLDKDSVLDTLTKTIGSNGIDATNEDIRLIVDEVFIDPLRKRYELTDLGNKERFLDLYGKKIRFYSNCDRWLVWDGARWVEDTYGILIQSFAEESVKSILKMDNAFNWDAVQKHHKTSATRTKINAFLALAQKDSCVNVKADALDHDPMLLCCQNGTLDLSTGKLREFAPSDMITKMCGTAYNPTCPTPLFSKFICEIVCGDVELLSYIQKIIGYSLTGKTSEQELYFWTGKGANGKSTLLSILLAMMGDYAKSTRAKTFAKKPSSAVENDLAALCGARMVATSELDAGTVFSDSTIKSLTGDDAISVRFLFKEYFHYVPTYKIIIAANHKPTIYDTSYAMWRRIRVIPFDYTASEEEKDIYLKDKIIANELPGVLAWAVEGCLKYQREGLIPPSSVLAATERFKEESNPMGIFLMDCCVIGEEQSAYNKILRNRYTDWCKKMACQPISQAQFSEALEALGFAKKRGGTHGEYVWYGVGLRNAEE